MNAIGPPAGEPSGALDAETGRLRRKLEGDERVPHTALNDRLRVLPAQARTAFVRQAASREEDFCVRLALYWLLDPSADVRLAAAAGLYGRVKRRIAEPALAALMPLLRNWIPSDTARRILDAALREARRCGLFAPLERPAYRRSRLLGTLPDGMGAQSLTAV